MPENLWIYTKIYLRCYSNIHQYRIIQRSLSSFDIFIAADETYLIKIHDEIMQNIKKEFPPGVKFKIKHVDQINPDPSGKLRKFISEVRMGWAFRINRLKNDSDHEYWTN